MDPHFVAGFATELGGVASHTAIMARSLGIPAVVGVAGLTRVFCEGGGGLAASLLAEDLVDELVGFTAGLALGAEGRPSLAAMGVSRLAEAPRFVLKEVSYNFV